MQFGHVPASLLTHGTGLDLCGLTFIYDKPVCNGCIVQTGPS